MAANIEGNIFTISVPLPGNPLRNLNSYVIRSEGRGRNLLIDTGFRMQPCREALIGGLGELGIDMRDTDIFLTHQHADHSGLAMELAGENSKVYISRRDGDMLINILTKGLGRTEEYRTFGFSEEELASFWENPSVKYQQDVPAVFTHVGDGEVLNYGGHRLEVIATPDHTPGHLCLYDRANKIMFLGDHVLFDITPNITTWPGFDDPLGHYVHSLMDISIFDVRLPLPAHRGVKGTMAERIGTIIEHHGARIRDARRPGGQPGHHALRPQRQDDLARARQDQLLGGFPPGAEVVRRGGDRRPPGVPALPRPRAPRVRRPRLALLYRLSAGLHNVTD